MLALETRSLTKTYGHRHVVCDFNMHVPEGSVYGFVGKNGAGKSTVMKMVDHLVRPTSGCIYLFGQENSIEKQQIPRRVGSLIEDPGVLPDMSTLDNLTCKALAIGLVNPKERCLEMLEIIGLREAASKRVKKLSLGMKQRLGVGLALLGSPDLLLLDEPFNGLDPEGTRELRALIVRLNKEQGVTVVISSPVLDQLDRVATDYGIIAEGTMVAELSAHEVDRICGDSLKLRADKPEQALVKLQEALPTFAYSMEPGEVIRISGTADADLVAITLKHEGIAVLELSVIKRDIEDFFIEMMERGGRDVQSV